MVAVKIYLYAVPSEDWSFTNSFLYKMQDHDAEDDYKNEANASTDLSSIP